MLSCKGLWKVFGANTNRFFTHGEQAHKDSAELARRIQGDGLIPAVCDVSLDFREGEVSVIMGLSGSGKSTLVRCLSRLIDPSAGQLLIGETDMMSMNEADLLHLRRRKMGMVFQSFGLLPHLSAWENIAFPLDLQGVPEKEQKTRVNDAIQLVRLTGREDGMPAQLSGGQQQRVGIARSLIMDPEIWFLDEPFSALDPLIRKDLQNELLRLQRTLRKTIIFITHDFDEAVKIADNIAIMKDGFVVQHGTPAEIVFNPANDYVAEFARDVRRDTLMRAGDAVEAIDEGGFQGARQISAGAALHDAIAMLVEDRRPIRVISGTGTELGQITSASILKSVFSK